jgi:hypothetical protein
MRREGIVGGVEVYRHAFLTKALDGGEWSPLRPGRFIPRKKKPVHIDYRQDGPQSGYRLFRESLLPLSRFDPRIVNPVAC